MILWLALGGALTALPSVRTVAQICVGDCNGDAEVSIDEIVKGVNIGLGFADVSTCPTMDKNHDLEVTVDELITAVANALNGCPMNTPTPTEMPPGTSTPTATPVPTIGTGNSPPMAVDDAAATLVGEPILVAVLTNDSDPNNDPLRVTTFTQPTHGTVTFANSVATYTPNGGFSGNDRLSYTISDGHGGSASASVTVVVNSLPPDPATVAPPPANGVATSVAGATSFLYTGANAVQFGVAPGTVEPLRAAVVRGQVKTRAGNVLAGVRITIMNHPEFGFTASRADGMFDLAVNGGGPLIVDYQKTGFCPVQRQLNVPWQNYAMAPDVMMTPMDPVVTTVALGSASTFQVAQSSMQSDADGTRHAMMLFTPGTSASVVLANGTTQTVSSLHVRATEFTVGASGPAAMPAVLPPTSGYTYAVELSADEAMVQGGSTVQFDRPVFTYLENFIGFPVGMAVPAGFYDRKSAAWVPSQNGRVIKILSITGGLADVDTDGDALADNTGIADGERAQLASAYAPGQTLWRVPVTHFTPWDFNWPLGPPGDVITPAANGAGADNADDPLQDPTQCTGCILEVENQVLGHAVPIVGTPYSLNYRSDRVPGRAKVLNVTLSGPAAVPADLQSIEMHLTVAGQTVDQSFSPAPNQHTTFVWNGRDAYGRPSQGGQLAAGSIDYIYPAVYRDPSAQAASFSQYGDTLTGTFRQNSTIALSQPISQALGEGYSDARAIGLGGWTLSVHHFYDPVSGVLAKGDGSRRRVGNLSRVIRTAAADLNLNETSKVKVAPDGSVFIAESRSDRVLKVATDGTVSRFAGGGRPDDGLGDGGPATSAVLHLPIGLAFGNDGSVYITDFQQSRVRRVGPDGIITTVAGSGIDGHSDDPGPATQAQLFGPAGIAVGADGSLFIVDSGNSVIRRVTPDGIINTIAGGGVTGFPPAEGKKATDALLGPISGIALGPDGSLYVAAQCLVYRISPDGIITTVAGDGNSGFSGDGGPATAARIEGAVDVAFGPDGTMYIAEESGSRVRAVRPDGIIVEVAGNGLLSSPTGDGGPATMATIGGATGVDVAPDGSLYIASAQFFHSGIRRIQPALPAFTNAPFTIASEDGSELYVFDAFGRHLRTLNTLTGATLFEFGYDANGLLTQVTEKTGGTDNVTSIQHDGAGKPTAIIGPFGQQTTLTVDTNGFLAAISNPASEAIHMTSDANGLMAMYTDPRGKTSTFTYESQGRLTLDAAPAGATQTLTRVEETNAFTVSHTTTLGRTTTNQVENLDGNVQRRTVTAPDNTQNQSTEAVDAATTHTTSPDGTTSDTTLGPDPRFSMESPVATNLTLTFPSNLQTTVSKTSSAVLANSADPLSMQTLTKTTTVDGHTSTVTYTALDGSSVARSPLGRSLSLFVDGLGRITGINVPGIEPSNSSYDDRGRLAFVVDGTGANARTNAFTYNAQGYLKSFTDPLNRTAQYTYDLAGRVTQKTLPDGRMFTYGYDAAGNLTSVTPPGRLSYTYAYNDRNELTSVTPPAVPGTGPTTYVRDADRALTSVSRPGGQTVTLAHDSAGRLASRTLATGGTTTSVSTFSYDPTTGNLSAITGPSGIDLSYAYDGSLLTSETWSGPVAGVVTRAYNTTLRLATESVSGTPDITFGYDADGLLAVAGDLAIARDMGNGSQTTSTLGITSDARTYDSSGHLITYAAKAGATSLYDVSYTRDALGHLAQKVETVGGTATTLVYAYDLTGRLTDVTTDGAATEHYEYDSNGNRTNAIVRGATVAATYDAQDRLTQYGSVTPTYNAAGYLLSKTNGVQKTSYQYDEAGNLLSVNLPDGTAVTYLVDGQNRRVGKRVNGPLVRGFLYGNQLGPVAELDGAGAVVSRFVYAGGLAPAYLVKGGVAHRIFTDQAGSVRLVVNTATGAIVQRMDYDAFGNVLVDTNPGFQPFGFAGGLYDPDTKLVDFGARDYDADTGCWTARDPVWFAGLDANLYRYVRSDPVNSVDPSGFGSLLDSALDVLNDSASDPLDFYGGVFESALDIVVLGSVSSLTAGTGLVPTLLFLDNHSVLGTLEALTQSNLIDTESNVFAAGRILAPGSILPCGEAGAAGEAAAAAAEEESLDLFVDSTEDVVAQLKQQQKLKRQQALNNLMKGLEQVLADQRGSKNTATKQ